MSRAKSCCMRLCKPLRRFKRKVSDWHECIDMDAKEFQGKTPDCNEKSSCLKVMFGKLQAYIANNKLDTEQVGRTKPRSVQRLQKLPAVQIFWATFMNGGELSLSPKSFEICKTC